MTVNENTRGAISVVVWRTRIDTNVCCLVVGQEENSHPSFRVLKNMAPWLSLKEKTYHGA